MMSPQENFDDILRQKMLGASIGISDAQRQRMEAYLRKEAWLSRIKRWGATAMACSFMLLVQADFIPIAASLVATKSTAIDAPKLATRVIAPQESSQQPLPTAFAESLKAAVPLQSGIGGKQSPVIEINSQVPQAVASVEKETAVLEQHSLQQPLMHKHALLPMANTNIVAMPMLTLGQPSSIEVKTPAKKSPSFYAGIGGAMNNTWIYNQNTYGAFGNTELAYAVDWGMSGGVSAGLRIRRGLWLETGYNLIAQQGQKYKDIIGHQVVYREVNLSYHQIPLLLKFENRVIAQSSRLLRSTFNIGIQYGLLNSATINNNGSTMSAKERFRDAEWSLVAGKSFTFSLSKRLALESSIYTKLGSNINADKWMAQDAYGKSHNLTFGAQLHLLYFLGQ